MLMLESATTCIAIIASICVSETATADITQSNTWSGAVIHVRGVEVTSQLGSDLILSPNRNSMKELCVDGSCLLYRGHCGKFRSKYVCTLWYSSNEIKSLRKIKVMGKRELVPLAMMRLKLVHSAAVQIALSQFRFDADNNLAPACYPRDGCAAN